MSPEPLNSPLARGRTAELYAWESGTVLKLYLAGYDRTEAEHEAHKALAVHASGLPVPAVGEIVSVGERWGLVYERVEGPTMLTMLGRKPWHIFSFARRQAALHAQMHSTASQAALPAQRQELAWKIQAASQLSASLRESVLAALAALPEGSALCHGDFHPENILITAQGEVIIDWVDATLGNPLADVARTTILMLGAAASDQVPNPLLKQFVRGFHQVYLRTYFHLRPQGQDEYRRWLPVVAAARLSENITEQESFLLAQAGKTNPL
jgi:uncharacterized protein (TIGR02172 family)